MKTDLLPWDHYFVLVVTAQIGKLWLILLQPDTHLFLNWFLGFTHHRPYEGYFPLVEGGPATSFVDYSAIWYFFYYPTFYGYHAWFLFSWCIETLFLAVIYKNHGQLYTLYILQLSFLFSINSPQDFLPYLFIVIGRVQWKMLPFAIAVKLPLLPPIWTGAANDPAAVWNFILYSPVALHASSNWVRYGALSAAWVISLILYLHDHRQIRVNSKDILAFPRFMRSTNANPPSTTGDRHWPRARRDGSDVHIVRLNGSRRFQQRASAGDHHTIDLHRHHTVRRRPALPWNSPWKRARTGKRSDWHRGSWCDSQPYERAELRSRYGNIRDYIVEPGAFKR